MTTRYDSYLLRIWRKDEAGWAGRLEHLPDGHSLRFGNPEALLAHLRDIMAEGADGGWETLGTQHGEHTEEVRQREARDHDHGM